MMENDDAVELNRLWVRNAGHWIWHLALVGVLLWGLRWPLPVDFIVLQKLAVCASFAIWAMAAHGKGRPGWRNLFVVVAATYNPFFPIPLTGAWPLLFVITAGITLLGGLLNHEPLPDGPAEPAGNASANDAVR